MDSVLIDNQNLFMYFGNIVIEKNNSQYFKASTNKIPEVLF